MSIPVEDVETPDFFLNMGPAPKDDYKDDVYLIVNRSTRIIESYTSSYALALVSIIKLQVELDQVVAAYPELLKDAAAAREGTLSVATNLSTLDKVPGEPKKTGPSKVLKFPGDFTV